MRQTVPWGDQAPSPPTLRRASPLHFSTTATSLILLLFPNILIKPITLSTTVLLIPLELIRSNRDSVKKARETHLIDKAMTLEPYGINRRYELN